MEVPKKCPNCGQTTDKLLASTSKLIDKQGRFYQLPCYFCVRCQYEELVSLDEIQVWAQQYWDTLPTEIRPSRRGKKSRVGQSKPNFPDYL